MNVTISMSNGKEILEDEATKGKEARAYGHEPNPKNPKTGKPKPAVYLPHLRSPQAPAFGTSLLAYPR